MAKGEITRERIIERAGRLASKQGLYGLTLGVLAKDLEMSKSGIFAYFDSKEDLQIAVLKNWAGRYQAQVVLPTAEVRDGATRLVRFFELWLDWLRDKANPGGCPFLAACTELDDRPGRVRDHLVTQQAALIDHIAALVRGSTPDKADGRQYAFELLGIIFATHHALRLVRDPKAIDRAQDAFARMNRDFTVLPDIPEKSTTGRARKSADA